MHRTRKSEVGNDCNSMGDNSEYAKLKLIETFAVSRCRSFFRFYYYIIYCCCGYMMVNGRKGDQTAMQCMELEVVVCHLLLLRPYCLFSGKPLFAAIVTHY